VQRSTGAVAEWTIAYGIANEIAHLSLNDDYYYSPPVRYVTSWVSLRQYK
jgi:hypothetical protein